MGLHDFSRGSGQKLEHFGDPYTPKKQLQVTTQGSERQYVRTLNRSK